jgi:predicted adenylyl cyclase CyaB
MGRVRKQRLVYLVGRTRVHIDEVEGLGSFVELEVVLADDEPAEAGEVEAHRLMQALGIQECDLLAVSYLDLLNQAG